jgi:hypothetical protein
MSFVTKTISGLVGGLTGSSQASAAENAGELSYAASQEAIAQQKAMFEQIQKNLQPYMQAGNTGTSALMSLLGLGGTDSSGLGSLLTQQFSFDPSNLESTPGYQFNLAQGTKALNNNASAMGLNQSGAQQQALASFASGLADNTYQNQFNNALQSYATNYGLASDQASRLSGLASLGQNAAAGVGNAGQSTTNSISSLLQGGASALGSAGIGSANAGAAAGSNLAGLGALLFGGSLFSDARLKENVEVVGETANGNTLYRYNYKGDPEKHIGVMAQEVEVSNPSAVHEVGGVKVVDYGAGV